MLHNSSLSHIPLFPAHGILSHQITTGEYCRISSTHVVCFSNVALLYVGDKKTGPKSVWFPQPKAYNNIILPNVVGDRTVASRRQFVLLSCYWHKTTLSKHPPRRGKRNCSELVHFHTIFTGSSDSRMQNAPERSPPPPPRIRLLLSSPFISRLTAPRPSPPPRSHTHNDEIVLRNV